MAESKVKGLLRHQMTEVRATIEKVKAKTAPQRAEREKIAAQIGKLQDRMAELTEEIRKDDAEIWDLKSDLVAAARGLGAKSFGQGQAEAEARKPVTQE